MCPGDKTQPFHATIHQLALQNILPSFSFKASHNTVFMHMLTHFKKWGQININWLSSLTSKVMGKFGLFKIPSLPRPGGAWFSWSTTHPLSRRSLPAVTQSGQPNCGSRWRAWGALGQTPCVSSAHLQIPTNSFPSQLCLSEHGSWLAVPYDKTTLCFSVWHPESSPLPFAGAQILNPRCSQEDSQFPGCSLSQRTPGRKTMPWHTASPGVRAQRALTLPSV